MGSRAGGVDHGLTWCPWCERGTVTYSTQSKDIVVDRCGDCRMPRVATARTVDESEPLSEGEQRWFRDNLTARGLWGKAPGEVG